MRFFFLTPIIIIAPLYMDHVYGPCDSSSSPRSRQADAGLADGDVITVRAAASPAQPPADGGAAAAAVAAGGAKSHERLLLVLDLDGTLIDARAPGQRELPDGRRLAPVDFVIEFAKHGSQTTREVRLMKPGRIVASQCRTATWSQYQVHGAGLTNWAALFLRRQRPRSPGPAAPRPPRVSRCRAGAAGSRRAVWLRPGGVDGGARRLRRGGGGRAGEEVRPAGAARHALRAGGTSMHI